MGQPAVIENDHVIDETFAGLANPAKTIEIGKDDVEGERPGAVLIDAVKQFERDGGFKRIQEKRNEEIAAADATDAAAKKSQTIEIDVTLPATAADLEKDREITEE